MILKYSVVSLFWVALSGLSGSIELVSGSNKEIYPIDNYYSQYIIPIVYSNHSITVHKVSWKGGETDGVWCTAAQFGRILDLVVDILRVHVSVFDDDCEQNRNAKCMVGLDPDIEYLSDVQNRRQTRLVVHSFLHSDRQYSHWHYRLDENFRGKK